MDVIFTKMPGEPTTGPSLTSPERWARVLALIFLACWGSQVWAAPDPIVQRGIAYLLTRLETSGCQFFRNGDWYDAKRGRQHLEKKTAWLVKKDLVASAEQFIERAASASSRSGEPYLVKCADGSAVPSAVWLMDELIFFRTGAARE